MRFCHKFVLATMAGICVSTTAVSADDNDLVDRAVKAYEAGKMDQAVPLLIQALKEDEHNGKAHQYLELIEKRMGKNAETIKQLETAIKLCPAGMLEALTKQALSQGNAAQTPPQNNAFNFFPNMTAGFWRFFGGNNQKQASGNTAPGMNQTASAAPSNDPWQWLHPPDLMTPVREMMKNTKTWVKQNVPGAKPKIPASQRFSSSSAVIIHMDELQELVEESHTAKWNTNPGGVTSYVQAPEFTPEWDTWISNFKRAVNIVLTRHLLHEAKNETSGAARVVFSVNNSGELKACIYSTTGDDNLNEIFLRAIRELNHNRGLAFPKNTSVTGWNFCWNWDFGRLLTFIRIIRERTAELAKATIKIPVTGLSTNAKIKVTPTAAHAAIGILPASKKTTRVAVAVPRVTVKTELAGQIIPKPKPVELKAVPLRLTDLIGKNVKPPADFQDVIDAMNIDEAEQIRLVEEARAKAAAEAAGTATDTIVLPTPGEPHAEVHPEAKNEAAPSTPAVP